MGGKVITRHYRHRFERLVQNHVHKKSGGAIAAASRITRAQVLFSISPTHDDGSEITSYECRRWMVSMPQMAGAMPFGPR